MNQPARQLSRYGWRPADPPRRPVLFIYPDSGHGALFQYAPLFVSQVAQFLDSSLPFQAS
jgi:hypothetical protein